MTSATQPAVARLEAIQKAAIAVGVVGLGLTVVGAFADPVQFFRSYLFGYLFWLGIGVGCLSILMIQHLTGGMWGRVIRRILEAGTRTFPLLAVLFIPIVLGLGELYVWTHAEQVAADPVLQHKSAYLNVSFFLGRAAVYFLAWLGMAFFLNKWSLEQDQSPGPRLAGRLRSLSGPGLVAMALTITFSSVDWGMSLDPHWFSTMYGVLFMIGQALSAMALVIVMVALLAHVEPLASVVQKEQVHDLGKLLLAFVMLWAYVNFSQLLIVWSGNLPEEIPWYIQRLHGGWQWLALGLVVFHFALPFLMLLSRDLKRNAKLLGGVAALILLARSIDLFWLLAPSFQGHGGHGGGLSLHWLDFSALVGIGGAWVALFAWQLKGRPLLPLGEPSIRERLEAAKA